MREKFGFKKLQNEVLLEQFRTMSQPALVSRSNGISGKLSLAVEMEQTGRIGHDLVAACVNDLAALGAKSLFFYANTSCVKPTAEKLQTLEDSMEKGCKEAGITFAGNDLMELSDKYAYDDYGLVGFAVGILDRKKKIGTARLTDGDVIIGLSSGGLHNHGYTSAKKQLFLSKAAMDVYYESLGMTLGQALLRPTKLYQGCIQKLCGAGIEIKSCIQVAHGGLDRALRQLLRETYGAVVKQRMDTVPPLYAMLRQDGNFSMEQMRTTFNMGIGMLLIVSENNADRAAEILEEAGEEPIFLGLVETDRELIRYIE